MPGPTTSPLSQAWETAETEEMKQVVHIYGKVYHLWQTDRGDALPLGQPKLMTSFTADGQFDFEKIVGDRDHRFSTDWERKKDLRKDIEGPEIHSDADWAWKERRNSLWIENPEFKQYGLVCSTWQSLYILVFKVRKVTVA